VQVEELLQTKPAQPSMTAGSMAPGSSGSSTLDIFTKKLKSTMVELINADLSQPVSQSTGHSPVLTPRQHEQQPSRSNTPTTPKQPSQLQPQVAKQSPGSTQQQQQQQRQQPDSSSSSSVAAAASAGTGEAGKAGSDAVQQPGTWWSL
jgi:hypothetical protein